MSPRKRAKILEKVQQGRATRMERMLLKQEGLCFYCWETMDGDTTKEHLDAKANGGTNEPANLRAAHMACNGIVGSLSVVHKLELHEIGRDRGAAAFWHKAREYQQKYGDEKKAYRKAKDVDKAKLKTQRKPQPERKPTMQVGELILTPKRCLSRYEKATIYDREMERRKNEGHTSMTLSEWYRWLERRYGPAVRGCHTQAALLAA